MTINERVSDELLEQMSAGNAGHGIEYGNAQIRALARELQQYRAAADPVYQVLENGSWTDYSKEQLDSLLESKPSTLFRVAYAAPQVTSVPETLPCPVILEPGLRFGKGVRTQAVLDALQRRATYYSELESMTPEQLSEHDSGIKEFAAMLAAPALQAEQLSGNTEQVEPGNSPVIPDSWLAEAERLAELHGASFVLFRHGQEPVCADPSKFWFGYDPAAAEEDFRGIPNSSTNNCRENADSSTKCWCHTCRPVTMTDMRFVVCPECGNKRCPHANDHKYACTGRNEPGQEGSAYPAAPQQEAE